MRLIDADAFKTQVAAVTALQGLNVEKAASLLMLIDQQPTVEAEPVVHARWINERQCTNDVAEYADYIAWLAATESSSVFWDCGHCGVPARGIPAKPPRFCQWCGAKIDADAPERGGEGLNV